MPFHWTVHKDGRLASHPTPRKCTPSRCRRVTKTRKGGGIEKFSGSDLNT